MSQRTGGPNGSADDSDARESSDSAEDLVHQQRTGRRSLFAKHPFLVYTTLRIGILLVVGAVLSLLGARGLILILLAFALSAVVSYVLLSSQRDEVGSRMGGFFGRLNERIEVSTRSEDDLFEDQASVVHDEQSTPPADTGIDPPEAQNNSAG